MKTKLLPLCVLTCIGAGLMMMQACKKDTTEDPKPDVPFMEQAKTYFENQVLTGKNKEAFPSISKANKGLRQLLARQAIWEKASLRKISIGEAVIVPLHYDKSMYTKVGKNKQSVTLDYLSYLMIYKTPKGKMTTELVTWIPEDTYWDNRRSKNKLFSGKVIVENWQGNFIKGYSYGSDGSIRGIEIQESVKKENQTSVVSVECETIDWYTCVSIDGREPWYCNYNYSETTCYITVWDTDGGIGDGSSGDTGTGGGTNPGDYTPPNPNPCKSVATYSNKGNSISVVSPCGEEEPVLVEPLLAYKIAIHKILMKNAAAKLGFCASAIAQLEQGVEDTDWKTFFGLEFGTSIFHFDGLTNYEAIKQNWELINSGVNTQQTANNYYKLGFLTHAFQDFYAHSNYAELLIKYYGDDMHNISFSDVLSDTSGQYTGLRQLLESNLKTGTFDLVTYFFRRVGAYVQGLDYSSTHNMIAKDDADTFAGDYSARLAELETHKILKNVVKCN